MTACMAFGTARGRRAPGTPLTGVMRRVVLAVALAAQVLPTQSLPAQGPLPVRGSRSRAALARSLDSIVTAEMAARRWPGVAVLMVRGTDTILHTAYGQADLELGVPARADGVYWIGSVTKQFVTAAIMRLAERGALSLEDSVGRWLPSVPWWWRGTTLRELMWHTSGIPSFTGAPKAALALVTPRHTADSALALVRDLPPDFARGTQMLYNNTGYVLLGRVIEAVRGQPLGTALGDELFAPLGLASLHYCSLERLVPGRVTGYDRVQDSVRRAVLWWPDMAAGAGALCGTVADLVRWSQALHGGRVLSPASYAQFIAPGLLSDGTPLRYGMGVLLTEVAGRRAIQHTGGIAGFTTWLAYLPDDSLHVAMTVNLFVGSERPSLAGVKLVNRVLGALPPAAATPLDDGLRRAVAGRYAEGGRAAVVADSDGRLTVSVLGGAAQPLTYRGTVGGVERFTTADGLIMDATRSGDGVARLRVDGGSFSLSLARQ